MCTRVRTLDTAASSTERHTTDNLQCDTLAFFLDKNGENSGGQAPPALGNMKAQHDVCFTASEDEGDVRAAFWDQFREARAQFPRTFQDTSQGKIRFSCAIHSCR